MKEVLLGETVDKEFTTLDDVAERLVEDRGECLSAGGTALGEPLGEGREPGDVDHQHDPCGPPAVGPGHIPSATRETRGQDRWDERREGRLRHPREDARATLPGTVDFPGLPGSRPIEEVLADVRRTPDPIPAAAWPRPRRSS